MKKKIMLSLAAVAMVGTLAVGGTLAWFTDTETATNVVTLGNVNIKWEEDGKEINKGDEPNQLKENAVPGDTIDKNALVKNVGNNDAYVRATIKYYVDDVEITGKENLEALANIYHVNIDNTKWSLYNGYYYYNGVVAVAGETNELITTISINENAGNDVTNQKFSIVLNAEAIQSDNMTGVVVGADNFEEELAKKFDGAKDESGNIPEYNEPAQQQ